MYVCPICSQEVTRSDETCAFADIPRVRFHSVCVESVGTTEAERIAQSIVALDRALGEERR